MKFISTKDMKHEDAPEGQVLVKYLEPFFGGYTIDYAIGFYSNPDDYIIEDDEDLKNYGWKIWSNERKICVLEYAELPEPKRFEMSQEVFKQQNGSFHPHFGSIGE